MALFLKGSRAIEHNRFQRTSRMGVERTSKTWRNPPCARKRVLARFRTFEFLTFFRRRCQHTMRVRHTSTTAPPALRVAAALGGVLLLSSW